MLRIDGWVAMGSGDWWRMLALLAAGRAADMVSTRLATPTLAAEANPVARRLGWRGGLAMNALVVPFAAMWPLVAVAVSSTSALVAARNLQWAWIIRSMGESGYRCWMAGCVSEAGRVWPLACHWGEGALVAAVGGLLMEASELRLAPFGVGVGLVGYGLVVALFATLSLWRAGARTG